MSDWTAGYIADIGYTYGYYSELNPLRSRLAFLYQGLVCPQIETACELGFGQGLSVNMHAAASVIDWHGTDFNPSQASFAQNLALASGAKAKLYDEAFAEFCHRPDLPDFDYIGLHGIWTWISDENRTLIVDFLRRKLKVGGILYVSYNTLPGWSTFAPIRNLLAEHSRVMGSQAQGRINHINDAMDFVEKLLDTKPAFSRVNPSVVERLKKMKDHNRNYLVHEYINRDFHPMHFSTMAQWLEPAKVQYACSVNYLDAVDSINLTSEQHAFLSEIPDPMFRQAVRDFVVNQQFRKDYWVKGERKLSVLEQAEGLRRHRVILTSCRPDIVLKVNGALGEASLQETVYEPILDFLADHKVRTINEIEAAVKNANLNFAQILQAVMLLSGAGHLHAVQDDVSQSNKTSKLLNTYIMNLARGSNDTAYLASPITGGGHVVNRFHQLLLLGLKNGRKSHQELAQYAWDILSAQNQKLVKDGKSLETAEENLTELTNVAKTFTEKQIPLLKGLQIIN